MSETASLGSTKKLKKEALLSNGIARPCVLHVCTSCRVPGSPRAPIEKRAGYKLYEALSAMVNESTLGNRVEVKPADCLSLCPRPCAIALSSDGAWSYLFGDQHLDKSASDIVECIELYLDMPDGLMPRNTRPKHLRSSILGRVPPLAIAAGASGALGGSEPSNSEDHSDRSVNKNSKFHTPAQSSGDQVCL